MQWQFVLDEDNVTKEPLTAIGGSVGAQLVAVVGPTHLLTVVALRLHGPTVS